MGDRLRGKVAIVTGSTSGIGAGIALRFASEGACVVVSGRRAPEGEGVVAAIRKEGGRAVFQRADVRRPEDCARLCQRAKEEFGGLDILVNNAGIFPRASFTEITEEFWDALFEVNVKGAFLCSQTAAPFLRERGGGAIIHIGTCAAFSRGAGADDRLFAYGCSKGASYILTMKLAGLLAPDRIRVNWITCGWVLTEKELEVQTGEGHDAKWLRENKARQPMGQYTTVEDIAAGCVYLASDEGARVTGSNLNISAGICPHI